MSNVILVIATGALGLATIVVLLGSFLPAERTASIVERIKKLLKVPFLDKLLGPRVEQPRTVPTDPRVAHGAAHHAEKSGNGANP